MAQAIPLIAQIAAAALAESAKWGTLGTFLVTSGATLAGAYVASELMGGDAKKQSDDADTIRQNVVSTSRTIPLIYGTRLVGSNNVFAEVGKVGNALPDTNHHYIWVVCALGEGEIEGLNKVEHNGLLYDEIYIDGEPLWKFRFDPAHPEGQSGKMNDVAYWINTGTGSQTCPSALTNGTRLNKQDKFNDAMRYTAHVVMRFLYKGTDEHRFTGVPKIEFVVKGIKCTDPREPLPNKLWTDNPALVLYDILTNTRYGLGWDTSLIDVGSIQDAATYCDDKGWKLNYVCSSQLKAQTLIDTILAHYRGALARYNAQIYFQWMEFDVITWRVEDKHIARDGNGKPVVAVNQPSKFNIPDAGVVSYINKNEKWTTDRFVIGDMHAASDYLKPIDFIGYTNRAMAMHMGYYTLERERLNRSLTMTLRPDAVRLDVNDIVEVTSSELAISRQPLRIRSYSISSDGLIRISALWDAKYLYNFDYDPGADEVYEVDFPGVTSPPPSVYITGITEDAYIERGRSFIRLFVSFEPPDNYPWFSHVEVWVSIQDSSEEPAPDSFNQIMLASDTFFLDKAEEGKWYTIRLNVVSTFGLRQADEEAEKRGHRVVGVIEDDPPCLGYPPSISVEKASVDIIGYIDRDHPLYGRQDIAGYEFREGEEWDKAVFVAFKSGPSLSISSVRPGTHKFWMSPKHTNGRYCIPNSAHYVQATIEDPPPGTHYFDSWVIDYGTGTYFQMEHGTSPESISVAPSYSWGTYTSAVIDTENETADEGMVVYLDFTFTVSHPGGTWNENNADSTSWNQINATTTTWNDFLRDLYELEAPVLKISILYADNPSMTNAKVASRLELVSALIFGKYVQVKYELKDLDNSHIIVYATTLKAAYLDRPALVAV